MAIVVIQQCVEPLTMPLVNEPASRAEKAFSCLINPQAESSTTSTSNYKQLTSPTLTLTNRRGRRRMSQRENKVGRTPGGPDHDDQLWTNPGWCESGEVNPCLPIGRQVVRLPLPARSLVDYVALPQTGGLSPSRHVWTRSGSMFQCGQGTRHHDQLPLPSS